MADRQTLMETNRSIRTIKNELENLLEKGVIDDDAYENIHSMLPAEAPLRGGGGSAPARATPSQAASPAAPPPTEAMANMNIGTQQQQQQQQQRASPSPAPPSYANSTGGAAAPPPGPPPPPSKPILAHARALYRYQAADSRDLSFERDDKIAVHEYMNADWWMGRNSRTGAEGIFPKTYVAVEAAPPPPQDRAAYAAPQQPGYHNQPPTQQLWPPPQQHQYAPPQPQYGQPAGPPPQQNPYNSDTPPSAVANQQSAPADGQHKDGAGKAKEYGEKFGKKLGNAAIFGAGATLGGNLVNSIF
ncbi:hypothetical protein VDGE_30429 [Verticillium dahliae]|uniref:SH3 domain-containing protein n=1 Tax=Verticillium dahliae TaxID=27337 RepID=A0A444RX62_VERDA|nr:hypothetical protein VDGE_30429 [Verticillium dahliae]